MSLFNLPTLAHLNSSNLAVFVFDNQTYSGTRISYPTATAGKTDLAPMVKGAGIEHSVTVWELKDFLTEAAGALDESGLRFIVCKIEESLKHRDITRSNVDCWKRSTGLRVGWSAAKAKQSFLTRDKSLTLLMKLLWSV